MPTAATLPRGESGAHMDDHESVTHGDRNALIALLEAPPEAAPNDLEDVRAAPGEVASLHSNTPLRLMWIGMALVLSAGLAFGVWAVMFRNPL